MPLLTIDNLSVQYNTGYHKTTHAVSGVSLNIEHGESVGLVGESGCGKSTLSYAVLRLIPAQGNVMFNNENVFSLHGKQLQHLRQHIQLIFQDPFSSLNPRLSVGAALDEVLKVHHLGNRKKRDNRIMELLEMVGLEPEYAWRYPHEFSGGQRQRIGIARALTVKPSLIIADEPVSALDVSVQVQILNLMKRLQEQEQLAYLFIAHDLAVVRYMCTRIYVMYLGRIMESVRCDDLFLHPANPYTTALLTAIPDVEKSIEFRKSGRRKVILRGEPPLDAESITGCPFHPRCPHAKDICRTHLPELYKVDNEHTSRCHFAETFYRSGVRRQESGE